MRSNASRIILREIAAQWYVLRLILGLSLKVHGTGFPARDGAIHKARCFHYHLLASDEEKATFFKIHGSRWTEFARLKYFDLVRYTIIDPMHNWLQGGSFSLDRHVYISYTVRHGKTTMVFYVYQAEGSASIYSNKASWAWHPTQVHRDCKSIYTVIVSFAKQWNLSSSSLPCGRVRYPHVSASLQEVV